MMKLFRVIFTFYVSMGFHMLGTFVAGDNTIMISSRGPEMFPILRSNVSRLNIHIIEESTQPVYTLCGHLCVVHRFCVAINYKEKVDGNEPNCQLTNTTKHKFDENARTEDKVWTFRKVNADRSLLASCTGEVNQCRNGGTMIWDPVKQLFVCLCKDGFGGQRCEKDLFGSKLFPGKSCKVILAKYTSPVSGTYWIKLASNKTLQVYCDMETRGGGWTLAYSYTFTNYNSFSSGSNAATPRPTWPASSANAPISTTPPLSESSLGAVDWKVWKDIGKHFMVKSNINDWIVCQPSGGSIVTQKEGSISCQNIKNVATACSGVVPNKMKWVRRGPSLYASSHYYYFDGDTHGNWPVHDPCGKNQQNHKKGVSNPGGQIYLR